MRKVFPCHDIIMKLYQSSLSYYFRGPSATVKDYLNPAHFDSLRGEIADALAPVRTSSNPGLPVWLGETSDAYNSGTANVSDRFVSGFLYVLNVTPNQHLIRPTPHKTYGMLAK